VTPRSASYLEIYNESIFDLLSKEREGLTVKHAGGAGIEVAGLTVHGVSSVAEVQQVLDMGDRCVVNTHARVRLVSRVAFWNARVLKPRRCPEFFTREQMLGVSHPRGCSTRVCV